MKKVCQNQQATAFYTEFLMIKYKGHNLARGSHAAELHDKKEFDKLDKHLKEVDAAYLKLQGGPMPAHLVNYAIGDHLKDKE